jgi:valyl-tRNA synthetase
MSTTTQTKHYNPREIEPRWYQHWLDQGYFHSVPDDREPFSIVIPPPNVTGVLHMGHMLNNTIQDILSRQARLAGKNVCWVPGTDHASIATEAKVVKMLRERGIKKSELTRDQFMEYAWEWKEKYGGIILDQLKKLGASCDWERTRFTMEASLSKAVIHVFVDLFRKGELYRGKRITNWDPEAQTVLSNEEVIYQDENSRLYHVRYKVEGTADEWVTIATQRPETIMADTGLAINPGDERYLHLHGKRVIVPLVDRSVPIIADHYVDVAFGTGALKVTPAHDQNDYELGQKYGLDVIDILNPDGSLNELAQFCVGMDRFAARKAVAKLLEEQGYLVKIEDYRTRVGRSERTNAVVEPRLTLQWFLRMKKMAATALEAVRSGEVRFYPEHMWNMYHSWLQEENIRDWCISRQLWWGQRIPAWYIGDGDGAPFFVAETAEDALAQAREATGRADLQISDLRQDEDVVDTWFSSWLWPISVFDGFERQDELRYYYPTNTLVTGWDIMFFWVARMIMAGYEWAGDLLGEGAAKQPFQAVYFTGMVRDNKRRKMSKSLGNSPDALELIETYGADGVRFGLLSAAAAGNDIIFDAPIDPETGEVRNESKLCEQGRNFCNKLWNALRLIKGWQTDATAAPGAINTLAADWIEARLAQTTTELNGMLSEYRLSDAIMTLYKFIWDDFCSWYLEMIKPEAGAPIDQNTYDRTLDAFERMMVLLHPFMPFVTEEVWHGLRERANGNDCCAAVWPQTPAGFDEGLVTRVELAKQAVAGVREIRNSKGIKMREALALSAPDTPSARQLADDAGLRALIEKMAVLSGLAITPEEPANTVAFLVGNDTFYLELTQEIDVDAERERITKELDYFRGFKESVLKKLSNERFVSSAPVQVVDAERKKLADAEAKIKNLDDLLTALSR